MSKASDLLEKLDEVADPSIWYPKAAPAEKQLVDELRENIVKTLRAKKAVVAVEDKWLETLLLNDDLLALVKRALNPHAMAYKGSE